ncbi:MAG TPA: hypothetical protein VFN94_02975 [Nitrospiria bacterium]|nr:hypothetical protein [Nitrospiria bacterium]
MTAMTHFTNRWITALVSGALMGVLSACGEQNLFDSLSDHDTAAAKIEAAQIAVDNGDFTAAIATLETLCGTDSSAPTCDADTAALLGSAYAGRAGLNVFDLIATVTNTAPGTTSSFSSFSTLLPDPTVNNKNDLHDAVALLSSLANPTPNQSPELAVVAMADIVVTVGVDLTNGFDPTTGVPNTVPTLTDVQNAETASGTVTQVSNDIDLVVQGVTGSGLANEDITNDINQVEDAIDTDQDGTVSAAELQAFLASL